MNYNEAELNLLGNGDAVKKFNYELKKAIENCYDPNTSVSAVRKVVLEVKLKPDAERKKIGVEFQAHSKLAADVAGEDQMIMARKDGKVRAYISNAEQLLIPDYDEKVTGIEDASGTDGE